MTETEELKKTIIDLKEEINRLRSDFALHNHDGANSQSLKDVKIRNLNVTEKCKVGGVVVP